ncbi:hypothetical protein BOTBODRAFT_168698 [Botryobasidium botryosum FD-172 SS1]|uniref:RecF/RecN/SMC N-terminal domain-containing protein n=1 Tax=Botryobasidium botryosum (strain FD-172 SS1) TaxID=930990 RepID=A0A067NCD6_BOTB1|nr:hypothetical protein BOTBODRAFT_168698 [Botryobasidium botryosum FD-172 SS1]
MVKRKPNTIHLDDGEGSSQAKRARRDDSDSDEVDEDQQTQQKDEDRIFEEQNEAAIRAAIQNKERSKGGVAEHGIILALELVNFMCHKLLSFKFGPQINFIIGHNGSGKSAVLSAISVALGGKATSTGRGSGLKSFIKEGESVAEVTIQIKNEGLEAYRPEIYGDIISITRRFNKEGSSSYKIKGTAGKVVSTKKEELSAITDHMGIQVDNPLNVLTQDTSRQFLSASAPSDKYNFFLKGTQLTQLSEEYETILANIRKTSQVLEQKQGIIPDLQKAYNEARTKFNEASKARDQQDKLDKTNEELAWAHVAVKKKEFEKAMEEVAKGARKIPKIKEALEIAENDVSAAEVLIMQIEADIAAIPAIDDLQNQKRIIGEEIRKRSNTLLEIRNEEAQFNSTMLTINNTIKSLQARIDEEAKKLQGDSQGKRDELNRKMEEIKFQIETNEARSQEMMGERARLTQAKLDAEAAVGRMEQDINRLKKTIADSENRINHLTNQKSNKLASFGNNVQRVIDIIQNESWFGERPVGPLGLYVDVKKRDWADLMRKAIGNSMSAYGITDPRDNAKLRNILNQTQNGGASIFTTGRDIFDYSRGEPPENILTVLRVLEITDEWVKRLLINQHRIERTCVTRTRREADEMATERPQYPVISADGFRVTRYADGGGSSNKFGSDISGNDVRQGLFSGPNIDGVIQQVRVERQDAEKEYLLAIQELQQQRQAIQKHGQDLQQYATQLKQLNAQIKDQRGRHQILQEEAQEEAPASIAALEDGKIDQENQKESLITQFRSVQTKKVTIEQEMVPLRAKAEALTRQINENRSEQMSIQDKLGPAVDQRGRAANTRDHWAAKLASETSNVEELEKIVTILEDEFKDWTAKAEEFCPRVPSPRDVDKLNRERSALEKALADCKRRHGATVDEVVAELAQTKAALEKAEKEFNGMKDLNLSLKSSLSWRMAKWHDFRRHIALRCKVQFTYHLSNRGYFGKVLFDHVAGTLNLKVQTDELAGGRSRDKDPKSLSGGEKSFSTICLLLSLWEAIGCPIRCLDEFDVFMDAVNRRISMKMMIDTAKSSDGRQFILITPLDISNIALGPEIRIHKMSDPERGQTSLSF